LEHVDSENPKQFIDTNLDERWINAWYNFKTLEINCINVNGVINLQACVVNFHLSALQALIKSALAADEM